jgi:hypothetical protein
MQLRKLRGREFYFVIKLDHVPDIILVIYPQPQLSQLHSELLRFAESPAGQLQMFWNKAMGTRCGPGTGASQQYNTISLLQNQE